jgi:Beta-propeller repeat
MKWNRRMVCVFVFVGTVGCCLAAPRKISDFRLVVPHPADSRYDPSFAWPTQTAPVNLVRAKTLLKNATGSTSTRADVKALDLPLAFEPNVGQADSRVKFIARGKGIAVFLLPDEMMFLVPRRPESTPHPGSRVRAARLTPKTDIVTMRWQQGSAQPRFEWHGKQKLPGETNYFIGNDSRKWRTNVAHFAQVDGDSSIPGLSMVVYGNTAGIEYDLRLAPGADASKLRLNFSGAQKAHVDSDGSLLLDADGNELRMMRPAIYEEAREGKRSRVRGGYVIERDGSVGFQIARHDAKSTLVIDPSISVTYSTFLGGVGSDAANSIARDSSGNIYVGGTTSSAATFPELGNQQIGPAGSGTDFFIAKINPAASGSSSLMYLTFLGGNGNEAGGVIAVDANNDVAISGTTTSPDFPVTDLSTLTTGANDTGVTEIGPAGNALLFSTLFGGNGQQSQFNPGGLALDSTGNIYVASDTSSTNLPVTPGAFQSTITGNQVDGFLSVFQTGATPSLTYCTYLGAEANDQFGVGGIAVDGAGNVYLAGYTSNFVGFTFPAKNALQSTYVGGTLDGFLMKISPLAQGASDLVYATLLGGSSLDEALAVAVDQQNPPDAYVTGTTQSSDFPTSPTSGGAISAYQTHLHANATANAFLTVVAQNPTTGLTSITYSTYLGGSNSDSGQSIALVSIPNQVTVSNTVYVAGSAGSWDFPWHDNLQPFNGTTDAFVARLDPTSSGPASLIYATPLGGTAPAGGIANSVINGISTDAAGHVYVAGETTSVDFPTAGSPGNGFQLICGSCQLSPAVADAFAVAIQESSAPEPSVYFTLPNVPFSPEPLGTANAPQFAGIVNGGESPLHIFSLSIIGPNASDFSLIGPAGCTSQPVDPGGACSLEVGFASSIVGPEAAGISITDDAPGSPQVLELRGQNSAGSQPIAAPAPPGVDFGVLTIGTSSAQSTISVRNNGTGLLILTSVTLVGADTAQFQWGFSTDTCVPGAAIAAAASCVRSVIFSPKAVGTFHAEIDFTDNSGGLPGATQVVLLNGRGALPSVAALFPVSLAFGNGFVGASSAPQTVTLTSTGSAALNITGFAITGANASDFVIVPATSSPCPSGSDSLPSGGSCMVAVEFLPQSAGTKSASLTFTDNAAGSPQVVALTGTATVGASVQVAPLSWTFPGQSSGTPSAPKQFTVTNTGSSSVSISIAISGTNAVDFIETDNCVGAKGLASGSSCMVNVSFDPAVLPPAQYARAATMTITYGGVGSVLTVPLAGSATQPSVSYNLTSLNLGNQLAGTVGQGQAIQARNSGTGALTFSKIAISGANPGDFGETDNCAATIVVPTSVSPNGTCTVQVTFQPQVPAVCGTAAGSKNAILTLTDNVPGGSQTIPLAGTESDFCLIPQPATTPGSISVGVPANYNVASYPVGSSNGFSGQVALSCGGFPPGGSCTAAPASVTVAAGSSAAVQLNVTAGTAQVLPLARGARPERHLPDGFWRLVAVVVALLICLASGYVGSVRKVESPLRRTNEFRRYIQAGALALALAMGIAACGGGGGISSTDPPPVVVQTFTIAVTGTSACPATSSCPTMPSRLVDLTLTVQ